MLASLIKTLRTNSYLLKTDCRWLIRCLVGLTGTPHYIAVIMGEK